MTPKERARELRRAYEDADCEHGDFMCNACTDAMVERAITEAGTESALHEREACALVAHDLRVDASKILNAQRGDDDGSYEEHAMVVAAAIRDRIRARAKVTP